MGAKLGKFLIYLSPPPPELHLIPPILVSRPIHFQLFFWHHCTACLAKAFTQSPTAAFSPRLKYSFSFFSCFSR